MLSKNSDSIFRLHTSYPVPFYDVRFERNRLEKFRIGARRMLSRRV